MLMVVLEGSLNENWFKIAVSVFDRLYRLAGAMPWLMGFNCIEHRRDGVVVRASASQSVNLFNNRINLGRQVLINMQHQSSGLVIKAFTLQSVDIGLIPLSSYLSRTLKKCSHSFPA